VLEGCRHNGCKHLVFASSSSVYGAKKAKAVSAKCRAIQAYQIAGSWSSWIIQL
jgi:nucleoside-diphosphate-sugar epimerase